MKTRLCLEEASKKSSFYGKLISILIPEDTLWGPMLCNNIHSYYFRKDHHFEQLIMLLPTHIETFSASSNWEWNVCNLCSSQILMLDSHIIGLINAKVLKRVLFHFCLFCACACLCFTMLLKYPTAPKCSINWCQH